MKNTFTKFSYLRSLALILLLIGGMNHASFAECDTEQSASSTDNHDGTVSVTYTTGKNPFIKSNGTAPKGLQTFVTLTVYRYENNTTGSQLLTKQYPCSNNGETYTQKLDLSVLQPGEKYFIDVKFEYAISGGSSYCKTYINLIKTMGYPLAYITSCSKCYSEKVKITVYDPMHRAMDYAKVRVFKTLASGDEWLTLLTPENTVDIDTNYYYFYHEDLSEGDTIDYNLSVLYDGSKYVKHIWDFDDAYTSADEDDIEQGVCYDLNFRSTSESNAVKLEWDKILCDNVASITIYRYNYDGTQELASKKIDDVTSKYYSDGENIVSGYNYKYKIVVKDSDGEVNNVDFTYGRSTPNGYIAGSITTTTGVPIKGGLQIIAKRQDEVESDTTTTYYGVYNTDDGSYKISNIFYNTGSSFTVYPVMENHGFDPEKIRDIRLTDADNQNYAEGKNFKDTTALAIFGNVSQRTPDGSSCPMEGVSILRDDIDYSIVTDKNGDFLMTVPSAGKYKLTPDLDTHLFTPPYINIEIANDTYGINFLDTTEFKLEGYFSASCSTYIGTAKLNITALDGCFNTSVETDNSGAYSISLPARAYEVSVASFETIDSSFVTEQDIKDYFTMPDTVDITSQDSVLDFVYKFPPTLEILPDAEFSTCPSEMYIMEQADSTDIIFNVNEVFNGQKCIVDEGYIVVTQNITTSSDDFIADTVYISNGSDTLRILPGEPKVTDGDYLKKLTATAYVGNNVVTKSIDVLVVGSKPREQTFTTVTPDIPFLILHDPPGDGSYSYFEEGTTVQNSWSISAATTGTVNAYSKTKLGAKFEAGQFLFVETEVYVEIANTLTTESFIANNDELSCTFSTTESFGTSSNDDFVGSDADVYVGGAMNLIYAVCDIIEFNANDCSINKSQNLIVAPNGFATTFMYTEDHIKETVIPQLKEMSDLSETDSLKFYYKTQAESWEQIVELNHNNMEQSDFEENISINGGVVYESSTENGSSRTMSWETSLAIDYTMGIEAGLEVGGAGATLGASVGVKFEIGAGYSGTSSTTTKTGFVLEDDDAGDYFSIDVLTDPVYGTPVFNTVAGRSSCPYEENTQHRESLDLSVINSETQTLENDTEKAVFKLKMTNNSDSNEDQTYNLVFDATSNPGGAIVTIGGYVVGGDDAIAFSIPAFSSTEATVTVAIGPEAKSYSGLRFVLESGCDGSISDEVYLNVYYPTICSDVTISSANEVVTADMLTLNLSDYDLATIENFSVQACEVGSTIWKPLEEHNAAILNPETTSMDIPLAEIRDNDYLFRVAAENDGVENYSNSLNILVDRTAPEVEGLPRPVSGVLERGNYIYVRFDEEIDCSLINSDNIQLLNQSKNNAPVDIQWGCYDNRLVFNSAFTDVDSSNYLVMQVSGISDLYGNVNPDTTTWGFEVGNVNEFLNDSEKDSDGDGILDMKDNCLLISNPRQEDADGDGIGDVSDDDIDGDGIINKIDNCPTTANPDQADFDNDGEGDVCDIDTDNDGIEDDADNCIYIANPDQKDTDNDGVGDVCDDDIDDDTILNDEDNCPYVANADQSDIDGDGIGDACDYDIDDDLILNDEDNCPYVANADQADMDNDGIGDVCDEDTDGDGILNQEDNCPYTANEDQADTDSDGIGDICDNDIDGDGVSNNNDNCVYVSNASQADTDGDGIGDVCENDADADGIPNSMDNCPYVENTDQKDTDNDGIGDVCDEDIDGDEIANDMDNCVYMSNSEQLDTDGDGIGDLCDDDIDGDGILNANDNCPLTANQNQLDTDGDGIGDVCDTDIDGDGVNNDIDNCMYLANADQLDVDNNGVGDACENDSDGDGIPDATDNCPSTPNPDQADLDNDGIGDICDIDKDGDEMPNTYDNCPLISNPLQLDMDNDGIGDICDDDIDGDGVLNDIDNCPTVANYDQTDTDEDGNGDVCDGDIDGDGITNNIDNCPYIANADQTDTDKDGNGDVCDGDIDGDGILNENDNCPTTANPDQADFDNDGEGDVCDIDTDNDGIEDDADNCIYIANPDQKDTDNDGVGDVCDDDIDDDTILNDEDNCPYVANADQSDIDGDGIGDACDDDIDGDLILNDEDNCPYVANADQTDANNNGLGDICENDADGDEIPDATDNCPSTPNPDQADLDNDGIGDICDDDIDGDGVLNENDNCPLIANSDQSDNDNDGTGDACEVTAASDIQNKDKFRCIAFPNPFDNNVTLQINSSQQEELVLEVLDLTGRITYQKKVSVIIGENTFEIETKNWASGVYTYRLYGKENVVTNKIMKN